MTIGDLRKNDPFLCRCLEEEQKRQQDELEMIASESIQSEISLLLAGSAFNNKTAVGNFGNQRLQGSRNADVLERLAAERACEIFGADYANMNTYAGSIANFCAYEAVLKPHDTVLSLDPTAGAHQSHGGKGNVTSRFYKFEYFGIRPDTLAIDYEEAERKAKTGQPKLIVIGSAAYPRNFDFERLSHIAHNNDALLMADIAHFTGLIAAGIAPNPFPYADIVTASTSKTLCGPHSGFIMCKKEFASRVEASVYPGHVASLHLQTIAAMAYALKQTQTDEFRQLMRQVVRNARHLCEALKRRGFSIFTGGTDCHMLLIDVTRFGIDGVFFANVLNDAGIIVNHKSIPCENCITPGGVRAGTTVLTQRGMAESDMEEIADLFTIIAEKKGSTDSVSAVRERVGMLAKAYPITGRSI